MLVIVRRAELQYGEKIEERNILFIEREIFDGIDISERAMQE